MNASRLVRTFHYLLGLGSKRLCVTCVTSWIQSLFTEWNPGFRFGVHRPRNNFCSTDYPWRWDRSHDEIGSNVSGVPLLAAHYHFYLYLILNMIQESIFPNRAPSVLSFDPNSLPNLPSRLVSSADLQANTEFHIWKAIVRNTMSCLNKRNPSQCALLRIMTVYVLKGEPSSLHPPVFGVASSIGLRRAFLWWLCLLVRNGSALLALICACGMLIFISTMRHMSNCLEVE